MSLKIYKKDKYEYIVGIIVSIYLTTLFVAGQIYGGILYADLFLPVFFALLIIKMNFLNRNILFIVLLLIIYSLVISSINIIMGNNSLMMAFFLIMRFLTFCLMLLFGVLYFNGIIKGINFSMPVILTAVLFVTFNNYYFEQKAYYNYVQIPSTWSPAASGFTLSALGFYLLMQALYNKIDSLKNTVYSILFMVLGLLTFTNSSFGALSISLFAVLCFKIIFQKNKPSNRIAYLWTMIFISLLLLIFYEQVLSFFWRVEWMIINLEFRLNKVDGIKEAICSNIWCIIFGAGPGAHSFHSNAIWGQTTILAFDQLQGRILVEWGWLGSLLWIIFAFKLFFSNKSRISQPVLLFIIFGFLFGIGSEFIFENYSGQLYGLLLGTLVGIFINYKARIIK